MTDYLNSLDRLAGLFERGVITREEFDQQKSLLLASRVPVSNDFSKSLAFLRKNAAALAMAGVGVLGTIAFVSFIGVDLSQRLASKAERKSPMAAHPRAMNQADSVVSFESAPLCQPSDRFKNLLAQMATPALSDYGSPNRLVVFTDTNNPLPLSEVLVNGVTLTEIQPKDQWRGLSLVSVRRAEFTTGSGFQLRFRNPIKVVQRELIRSGFSDIPVGSVKRVEDVVIGLEEVDGSVALTCMRLAPETTNSSNEEKGTGNMLND